MWMQLNSKSLKIVLKKSKQKMKVFSVQMIQFSISFKQYNVLLWIYISYASSELVTQKLLHFENESRVKMEKFQILNFLFNGTTKILQRKWQLEMCPNQLNFWDLNQCLYSNFWSMVTFKSSELIMIYRAHVNDSRMF